jgi:hypothetical protein
MGLFAAQSAPPPFCFTVNVPEYVAATAISFAGTEYEYPFDPDSLVI